MHIILLQIWLMCSFYFMIYCWYLGAYLLLFKLLHDQWELNPLQCSCLENPRDGGALWAAFYGVAQSWGTRLKRLSSSSSSIHPGGASGKERAWQCKRCGFDAWVGKNPWSRKWQPTPVFLSGESLGERNLRGYSPGIRKEWDRTEAI